MNSYHLCHFSLLEYGDYKAFEERIYASSKLQNDPSPKEVLRTVTWDMTSAESNPRRELQDALGIYDTDK